MVAIADPLYVRNGEIVAHRALCRILTGVRLLFVEKPCCQLQYLLATFEASVSYEPSPTNPAGTVCGLGERVAGLR